MIENLYLIHCDDGNETIIQAHDESKAIEKLSNEERLDVVAIERLDVTELLDAYHIYKGDENV